MVKSVIRNAASPNERESTYSVSAVSNWLSGGIPPKHFRALVEHGRRTERLARWLTYEFLADLNKRRLLELDEHIESDAA